MRSLNVPLLLGIFLAGCVDSSDRRPPQIVSFDSPSFEDTLLIGRPFRLTATAEDDVVVESIIFRLYYGSASSPGQELLTSRLDNVLQSPVFNLDTLLVLPRSAQPTSVVGITYAGITASDGRSRSALSVPVILVMPQDDQ